MDLEITYLFFKVIFSRGGQIAPREKGTKFKILALALSQQLTDDRQVTGNQSADSLLVEPLRERPEGIGGPLESWIHACGGGEGALERGANSSTPSNWYLQWPIL